MAVMTSLTQIHEESDQFGLSAYLSGFVMNLYLISSDWQFEIVIDKKERKISHENHESMGQGVCGDSWGEFQPSQSPSSIKSAKIYIPWSRWTLAESTCDSSWLSSSSMCSMSFSILPGSLLTLTSSQDKGENQSEISQIYFLHSGWRSLTILRSWIYPVL